MIAFRLRPLLYNLSISLTSLGIFLLVAEALLHMLPVSSSTKMIKEAAMGDLTRFEPNRTITFSSGWDFKFNIKHRINNYGFVNKQDYEKTPGKPVIAIIGDSYVEAFQVQYSQSFHGRLNRSLKTQCKIYTLAASDAPLSQYLKWAGFARDEFQPRQYIISVIANDFDESDIYYGVKPQHNQFVLERGNHRFAPITYSPSTLKAIARESSLIRYLVLNIKVNSLKRLHDTIANALAPTTAAEHIGNVSNDIDRERLKRSYLVVDTVLRELPITAGVQPSSILFLVDALRLHIYGEINDAKYESSYFYLMRNYFINRANSLGYNVIDLDSVFRSDFAENQTRFEFPFDGHWNSYGHKQVFEAIIQSGFIPQF